MQKIDLRKELKYLYAPSSKQVEVVDVPDFRFVMIDGRIEPGETPETAQGFQEGLGALYGVSYTLKFASRLRKEEPLDYSVMALEGLWWTDLGEFTLDRTEPWNYTLMIMQPEHISLEMYQEALQQAEKKRDSPAWSRLRFDRFPEGLCIQIMHVGPYAGEPATLEKMRGFAQQNGYAYRGQHHEIYLGDPRRAKPEKLRTILRHPVERAAL